MTPGSDDALLARLAAIEDIRCRKAAYFFAVDRQDWPTFGGCFTSEGSLEIVGPDGVTLY